MVYEPRIRVTMSEYFEQISNRLRGLKPAPGIRGTSLDLLALDTSQFAPPERRIDARREQPPRRAMARWPCSTTLLR